jgi:flagellar motor protein MotB
MLRDEEETPIQPPWVLTFADMMTLLLTLFVLLVSMSELRKDDTFQEVANSLEEQFGSDRCEVDQDRWTDQRHAVVAATVAAARHTRQQLLGATTETTAVVSFTFSENVTELTGEQLQQLELTRWNTSESPSVEIRATSQTDFAQLLARIQAIRTALLDRGQEASRIHVLISPSEEASTDAQTIHVFLRAPTST